MDSKFSMQFQMPYRRVHGHQAAIHQMQLSGQHHHPSKVVIKLSELGLLCILVQLDNQLPHWQTACCMNWQQHFPITIKQGSTWYEPSSSKNLLQSPSSLLFLPQKAGIDLIRPREFSNPYFSDALRYLLWSVRASHTQFESDVNQVLDHLFAWHSDWFYHVFSQLLPSKTTIVFFICPSLWLYIYILSLRL